MFCIFCKESSLNSKSAEHIVPESLGNKSHTLPKGIVCDKCNNYFAVKIESKVLQLPYFKSLRSRNFIQSKKGKVPGQGGFINNSENEQLEILASEDNTLSVIVHDKGLFEAIKNGKYKEFYIPILDLPPLDNVLISRLIGKMAVEALAMRVQKIPGWQDDFIENEGINELRNFVRYGKGYDIWPYHVRRIYKEDKLHIDMGAEKHYQILHEFDFLFPDTPIASNDKLQIDNLYFIIAIMGVEYVVNLTNGGLSRYITWLAENNGKSILID